MPYRTRFPLMWLSTLAAIAGAAGTARADDDLLHGPHPFRRDNDISAHVLFANGRGDAMSGTKLAFDYGYKLTSGWIPLWLTVGLHVQHNACNQVPSGQTCPQDTGDVFETLGGVKWTFATPIPLVPYLGAVGGLVFAFPNGASAAAGPMLRAIGGVSYYIFDWFGLSGQVGYSLGSLNYDSTFTGSHTYAVLDIGGGITFQF